MLMELGMEDGEWSCAVGGCFRDEVERGWEEPEVRRYLCTVNTTSV